MWCFGSSSLQDGRGEIASALPALATAGVDEIIVNVDWEDEDAAGQYTRMRS